MTLRHRWTTPLARRAKACRQRFPWERGLRRSAFHARRSRPTMPRLPQVA